MVSYQYGKSLNMASTQDAPKIQEKSVLPLVDSGEKSAPVVTKPVESWKIYSDKKFGFEFKYSSKYFVKTSNGTKGTSYVIQNELVKVADFDFIKWKGTVIEEGTPGTFWNKLAYSNWKYFSDNFKKIQPGNCSEESIVHVPGPTVADRPRLCDINKQSDFIKVETENYTIFYTKDFEVRWGLDGKDKDLVSKMTATFKFIE